ncbi:PTS N,N'-diacetylchitobiose transporter subunit IIA [Enterobacter ludwigii]|uniref:PTS N,N'-diacetylchitobiose transporter subunit IIA n=1 Tax=Enterobacter ludwigii TaxID=299767 RepID=UPI0022E44730|nr:PTS N,N'-diacetylchitobiose transporter subunit IIA [Enterobacter ludwigii]
MKTQRLLMELEEQVMGIIINAGQSRSLCYEALGFAKKGDFASADALMKEAAHFAREAHLVQTQLIEADEGEGKTKMTLVMVHAQDHLMTSILAKELVTELIELYRTRQA